jgi:hypothetical protein
MDELPEQMEFHVKTGDYFAYLATALGFLEEGLQNASGAHVAEERILVEDMRKNLQYMNSRYCIEQKSADQITPIRSSGNLLAGE